MNPVGQPESKQGRRRSARARVFLTAQLDVSDHIVQVKLRDLSEHGALVECAGLTAGSNRVLLRRNDLTVPGRIAWARGNLAGLAFLRPLRPEVVLRHIRRTPQRAAAEPQHRRPAVTQRGMSAEETRWFEDMMRPAKGAESK